VRVDGGATRRFLRGFEASSLGHSRLGTRPLFDVRIWNRVGASSILSLAPAISLSSTLDIAADEVLLLLTK